MVKIIDTTDWSGAENDDYNYSYLDDKSYTEKFNLILSKPPSSIIHAGDPLNQDEFYYDIKGERRGSPYCTAYSAFHTYSHRFGQHPKEEWRRGFIEYCLENGIIHDTEERSGGSTIRTNKERGKYFNSIQNEYRAESYMVKMGSKLQKAIQKRGRHAVASSFIISREFARDRVDNNILDGLVHGGKKYNGHAMLEVYYTPSLLVGFNNYGYGDKNFIIKGKEYQDKRYDRDFHRRWGVITIYTKI